MSDDIVVICSNRKAQYNYDVLDNIEAGVVLQGTEIKSIREHRVSLESSYARVVNGEVWLIGFSIERFGNEIDHDSERDKKLLLHKHEIKKFAEKSLEEGFALVPLMLYLKNGKAKIKLAVAKGKKLYDKRNAIKSRDADREIKKKL